MRHNHKKKLSRKEIGLFKKMIDIRQMLYLGVRLVDQECEYTPEKIAEYAMRKGYASRLGYLAETSLEAAKNIGLTQKLNRTKKLIDLLYANRNKEYTFLAPWKNKGYDHKVMKKLAKKRSTHELNKKWKIYSATHAPDIEEYIELYLIDLREGNHVRVRELFPNSEEQLEENFKEFVELVYGN